MKQIKYSEIFGETIQGEGSYNGRITNWLRFFACNLECSGFGQKNPTDPSTYVLPYQEFDPSSITKIEDLPVWDKGCDSSYSWAKQYRHLAKSNDAKELAQMITNLNINEHNPKGLWKHPITGNQIHMCFTGGEPMMQQDAIINILQSMIDNNNYPRFVTIETNATKPMKESFIKSITRMMDECGIELMMSMSPKLFTVSGESSTKAWKPEIISQYIIYSDKSQVKFVVNEQSIDELLYNTSELLGVIGSTNFELSDCEFWVMPVGGTLEEQESHNTGFYDKLIRLGYNVADRTHVRIWGNAIGK